MNLAFHTGLSALEALRNALYKFKIYFYLLGNQVQQNTEVVFFYLFTSTISWLYFLIAL